LARFLEAGRLVPVTGVPAQLAAQETPGATSVFISMARSEKIPARFQIGFPLPADEHTAEIPGYHGWAGFYGDGIGSIPADISEAWKHPKKRDCFFGARDVNRVQFSEGRDLYLKPEQDGPPPNHFVYPYVEVDGKEHPNVSIAFSFSDAASTPIKVSASREKKFAVGEPLRAVLESGLFAGQPQEGTMPKYVIEREIPNAGKLSQNELQAVSQKSCGVLEKLGPQVQWLESFVTDDKIYCIYIAPNEEMVREHARQGGFPANRVSAVRSIIGPTTAEG